MQIFGPVAIAEGCSVPDCRREKSFGRREGARFLTGRDRVSIEMPGGGGYGDPKERDRALVERDVEHGFITREQAERFYGFAPGNR